MPATLRGVLDGYARAGYDSSFTAEANAEVVCHTCEQRFDAREAPMASRRRLEGASDPDDMLAVVALACPACGARGTLVLGYGPSATAEDADVLLALPDERDDGPLPPNSTPGEAHGDASAPVDSSSATRTEEGSR